MTIPCCRIERKFGERIGVSWPISRFGLAISPPQGIPSAMRLPIAGIVQQGLRPVNAGKHETSPVWVVILR